MVPEGYSARLETGTTNGGMTVDFPVTVEGRIGRRLTTDLGTGGPPVTVVTNVDHVPVTVISQTVAEVMTTATADGVTGASDKEGKALDGITVTPASDDDTTTADASSTPDALIITTTTTAEETTGQEWTLASSESVENVQTVSVPTVEGADTTTEDSDDVKLPSDPMATLSTVGIDQDLVSTTENSLYHDTTSGSMTPAFGLLV